MLEDGMLGSVLTCASSQGVFRILGRVQEVGLRGSASAPYAALCFLHAVSDPAILSFTNDIADCKCGITAMESQAQRSHETHDKPPKHHCSWAPGACPGLSHIC